MTEARVSSFSVDRVQRCFWRDGPRGGGPFSSLCAAASTDDGLELRNVRAFLWQGYVAGDETLVRGVRSLPGDATYEVVDGELKLVERSWFEIGEPEIDLPIEEIVSGAREAWLEAIGAELARGGGPHVLPLSAGLDSRLILAGLLEHLPASEIQSYTWGVPGSWDYLHAPEVARVAGISHVMLDYRDSPYGADVLREVALLTDAAGPVLFYRPIDQMRDRFGEFTHWSGFFGMSFGNMMAPPDVTDPETWFWKMSARGVPKRYAERIAPELEWNLPLDRGQGGLRPVKTCEELNIYNRQRRMVGQRNLPRGIDYRAPLIRPEWTRYMLRVAEHTRRGGRVRDEMIARCWPELARVPASTLGGRAALGDRRSPLRPPGRRERITSRLGSWVGLSEPRRFPHMGIPVETFIRENEGLRAAAAEMIEAASRRPFLDGARVRRLWKRFLAGHEVRWRLVDRVVALEAILQAHDLDA